MAEDNEIKNITEDTEEAASSPLTTTPAATTTTTLPKSCPAPDVTYNGSLLSNNVEAFKDIHDVEFEVRTGPFPGDNQRCKLSCVKGQWVGPLCRTGEGKADFIFASFPIVCKSIEKHFKPNAEHCGGVAVWISSLASRSRMDTGQ